MSDSQSPETPATKPDHGTPENVHTSKGRPPQAPLAFRVGVVGHRPNRLADANLEQLASVLKSILSTVREQVLAFHEEQPELFGAKEPTCRALSPLAEGTDRMFAEQALTLGFELCCVMPFPQAEFEEDFAPGRALEPDSLTRFQRLISQAHTRFELDGTREDEGAAYGAGGHTILNQSDVLVVVWDGERLGKRGGTEETFDEARRRGVPVVWVDAHAQHHWQVLEANTPLPAGTGRLSPSQEQATSQLAELVRESLRLPDPPSPSKHEAKVSDLDVPEIGLNAFYAERKPSWTTAVVWKAFRDLIGDGRCPRVRFAIPPFEEAVQDEWPANPSSAVGGLIDRMRPFYAWPDKLAVIYADRYRSAFILAFALAAFAVGMALLPFGLQLPAHHLPETLCIVAELVAIIVILAVVLVGRRRGWHERWINYRLAAELVRHLRFVAPLGGARPFPQVPAHLAAYGQPASTWMAWYIRAVERSLGLPNAVVDKDYVATFLAELEDLVDGQIRFHRLTVERSHRIEKRLHRSGIVLLALTLIACGVHLAPNLSENVHLHQSAPPLLTFCCGFFPALGASIAGILNQGEFRRVEKRSESMFKQLNRRKEAIGSLRDQLEKGLGSGTPTPSTRASALAGDVTRLLLQEVLDWRVVFLDRPPELPA